jgi:hypothetical protein
VQTYGSPSWIALAMRRMQAPASPTDKQRPS